MQTRSVTYFGKVIDPTNSLIHQIREINSCFENQTPRKLRCHCLCWGKLAINDNRETEYPEFCACLNSLEFSKRYLREINGICRGPYILTYHSDLSPHHRSKLFDWMAEVCYTFQLMRGTYHLAVDYVDRYLQATKGLQRNNFQLLGAAAILIASKYEEVRAIRMEELVSSTAESCKEDDILQMERDILIQIEWNCSVWTSNDWLFTYIHLLDCKISEKEYIMMTALIDISILDIHSLCFPYSSLATSAIFLTLQKKAMPSLFTSPMDASCSEWMLPFHTTLCKITTLSSFSDVQKDHTCRILKKFDIKQTYINNLELYELTNKNREDEEENEH